MNSEQEFLLEQWKMASELQRHEDSLTWERFSYFVTLTGFLATGYGYAFGANEPRFLRIISAGGAIISLAFACVFRRAYLYHTLRIRQASEAEQRLQKQDVIPFFSKTAEENQTESPAGSEKLQSQSMAVELLPVYQEALVSALRRELSLKGIKQLLLWSFAIPKTSEVIFFLSLSLVFGWIVAFLAEVAPLVRGISIMVFVLLITVAYIVGRRSLKKNATLPNEKH